MGGFVGPIFRTRFSGEFEKKLVFFEKHRFFIKTLVLTCNDQPFHPFYPEHPCRQAAGSRNYLHVRF
jgi:hypothetical protein